MSPLACPKCGTSLQADDVNLAQALGRCDSCNSVFSLDNQAGGMKRDRPEVEMPRGFHVTQLPNRLTITRRWFGGTAIFLLIFTLVWDGFLAFWYFMALGGDEIDLMDVLFPLLHVLIGLGFSYLAVAFLLNTTTINVEPRKIRIHHGPIPWPGSEHDPAQISQLFSIANINRSEGTASYTYELHAAMLDGKRKKIIRNLYKPEQALFLEQRLEKAMGITDRPVAGELAT